MISFQKEIFLVYISTQIKLIIMIMKKLKTFLTLACIGLFITSCATPGVPYTYINKYETETLPKIDNTKGSNTVSGSAFLRQGGGGIVNCAGNSVVLRKQNADLGITRNAYAKEYLALSSADRSVTTTDPRLIQFERDLAGIRNSQNKTTTCDVDGKFTFYNVAPGNYTVKTKVYWVVADQGQGGIVGSSISIPDNAMDQNISTVVNQVVRSCSIFSFYCNP